jgi:hypothetical protein
LVVPVIVKVGVVRRRLVSLDHTVVVSPSWRAHVVVLRQHAQVRDKSLADGISKFLSTDFRTFRLDFIGFLLLFVHSGLCLEHFFEPLFALKLGFTLLRWRHSIFLLLAVLRP